MNACPRAEAIHNSRKKVNPTITKTGSKTIWIDIGIPLGRSAKPPL